MDQHVRWLRLQVGLPRLGLGLGQRGLLQLGRLGRLGLILPLLPRLQLPRMFLPPLFLLPLPLLLHPLPLLPILRLLRLGAGLQV